MPAPSSSLATLRPDLSGSFTQFDLALDQAGFIGNKLLPFFPVAVQAGTFGKIPIKELLKNGEIDRNSRGGYSRGDWKFTTDSFATKEYGHEEPIDDREAAMYAEYFDAEVIAAMRARDLVLRSAEKRIAAALFDATTYAAQTTAVGVEWDTEATAVPITNVEDAVQRFYARTGVWPNAIAITKKVARNLRHCAQIVDRLKYNGIQDVTPDKINESMLAQVFDLRYVLVGNGTKNTANEGQTASLSPIWDDEYALITRVAETGDIREPCVGRTFHWAGDGSMPEGMVESYRDETVRKDIVRVRHEVQEKILYGEMVELLSNITT